MTNVVTADTVAPVELFDRILYCVERARAQGKSVRQLGLTIGSAGKVQRWIERGGIAIRGSLHVRRDPDADTVAARTLYLLSVELLRTSFPTGLSLPRRAVWSLAAELARVDAPHLAPSLLGRS